MDSINENSCWKHNLLNTLWSYAVPKTFKRSSMCQHIIKASQLRTALPSILFGFGMECGHAFRFKWLPNDLFKLDFSISYFEVNRFKKSVVANQPMGNSNINCISKSIHTVYGGQC